MRIYKWTAMNVITMLRNKQPGITSLETDVGATDCRIPLLPPVHSPLANAGGSGWICSEGSQRLQPTYAKCSNRHTWSTLPQVYRYSTYNMLSMKLSWCTTHTERHTHTCTCAYTHMHMHTHVYAQHTQHTHTCTHTHAHAHIRIHTTHTRAHAHTPVCLSPGHLCGTSTQCHWLPSSNWMWHPFWTPPLPPSQHCPLLAPWGRMDGGLWHDSQ